MWFASVYFSIFGFIAEMDAQIKIWKSGKND